MERDTQLSERMAEGDMNALAEAYQAYSDGVFTTALRLVGSSATAADITQDAFLRAYERAVQFRGRSSLGTWIGRIATNLALRHLHRDRWLRFTAHDLERAAPAGPASLEALALGRAIAGLPENLRIVFVLHAVEGYSHTEIAEKLHITEATSRQRLHRARSRLASELATGGEE